MLSRVFRSWHVTVGAFGAFCLKNHRLDAPAGSLGCPAQSFSFVAFSAYAMLASSYIRHSRLWLCKSYELIIYKTRGRVEVSTLKKCKIMQDWRLSYASDIAYLILSRELCLRSISYLRGECALHNFQMNSLGESRKN